MPALSREMSWLSPKRRRTTGNLKAIPNGQVNNVDTLGSPTSTPSSPLATSERPTSTRRPFSQPSVSTVGESVNGDGEGNLFYAYARKGDDLQSRYLLTFASARIANEWWLLLQTHFPDTSRPGPQLFSFKTEDLLSKAWRHPAFAHLKSKWMYIQFSDTSSDGLGGAAQGIIPVQDAKGNMLGGSAGSNARVEEVEKGVKQEAAQVKNEVHKLEEYFEKMMEAVERNTEKVAELAESRHARMSGDGVRSIDSDDGASTQSAVDMGILSGHFVRMNDLLSKNSQNVEQLAKKHYENEQNLKKTMETVVSRHHNDYLDMQQLSSHLDRIQGLMESSLKERKDSAREVSEQQARSPIDFSPLTQRLEKVQEAVEQNSALVKALLEESKEGTRSGNQQPQSDLSPLSEHLERIHKAVEQQSEHTKALVGFASSDGEGADSGGAQTNSLAPLSEHLEQIYNAIDEGNKQAHESARKSDLGLVEKHLEALRRNSAKNSDHMQHLVDGQNATREAIEANGGEIDFTPMTEYLEAIKESNDNNAENVRQLLESQTREGSLSIDFSPLTQHLEAVRRATEQNAEQLRSLTESQQASAVKSAASTGFDLTPLTDRLNNIHTVLQKQSETRDSSPGHGTGDAKFLMNALTSHLSKIQGITEQNATQVRTLHQKQSSSSDKMHVAVSETSEQVRGLVQRNEVNEARIEAQNSQMRELMSGQREMVEVMRQLAKSVVAQNKGACDHVVVPPPRKMGRKVVGFVYDAKEGTP